MQCLHLNEGDEYASTRTSVIKRYQLVDKAFLHLISSFKTQYLILSKLTYLRFHNLFWFTSKQVKFNYNLMLKKRNICIFLPTPLNSIIIRKVKQMLSRYRLQMFKTAKWTRQMAWWPGSSTVLYIQKRLR